MLFVIERFLLLPSEWFHNLPVKPISCKEKGGRDPTELSSLERRSLDLVVAEVL
jgi:hypothetical protein